MLSAIKNDLSPGSTFMFYHPEINTKLESDKAYSLETIMAKLKRYTSDNNNVKLIDDFSFSNFEKLPKVFIDNLDTAIQFLQQMVENGQAAEAADTSCHSKLNKLVIYNIQLTNEHDDIAYVSISCVIKNLEDTNDVKDSKHKPFHVFATSDGRIINDSTCMEALGYYEADEDPLPRQYGKYLNLTPATTKDEAFRIESLYSPFF